MLVQSISTDTLTVVRAYQSTTAATHNDNTTIYILQNNGKSGDSIDKSFVEHWDRATYFDDRNMPSSLKSRGLLMYANNSEGDNAGTAGSEVWTERQSQYQINYSGFSNINDDKGDPALIFGGTGHTGTDYKNQTQLTYMLQGETSRPTNYLLTCKTDKFNKLFFRMENTFKRASNALDSATIYDGVKLKLTAWYTAKATKHGSTVIWKPLSFVDHTATGGENSSLRTSGLISFDMPDDWVKTISTDLPWAGPTTVNKPVAGTSNVIATNPTDNNSPNLLTSDINNSTTTIPVDSGRGFNAKEVIIIDNEEMYITSVSSNNLTVTRAYNSTSAATHSDNAHVFITNKDPDNLWTESMYGLLFGMACQGDTPDHNASFKCVNVVPASNTHSAVVKVIDPHHKSLNDIGIAQSISWNRSGKYIKITDRLGRSEVRKIGAAGGQVTFGGVELNGEYTTQKKLLNIYQREGTPVYLDVQRARDSGEYIRFYGVITDMSEDYPAGRQHPKFGITMQIEYVSEFSGSTGTVIGDGVLMSLGGEIIDEPKYIL